MFLEWIFGAPERSAVLLPMHWYLNIGVKSNVKLKDQLNQLLYLAYNLIGLFEKWNLLVHHSLMPCIKEVHWEIYMMIV